MRSLDHAYRLQRKLLAKFESVGAFKVGGSNRATANKFGDGQLLLGGICTSKLYTNGEIITGGVGEVEIVAHVRLKRHAFEITRYSVGIEFPDLSGDVPSSSFDAVATNLNSGCLHVFDINSFNVPEVLRLSVNGLELARASDDALVLPLADIIEKAVALIKQHKLCPSESEVCIATGGLTPLLNFLAGDRVEVYCE